MNLPLWATALRPHQVTVIQDIISAYKNGTNIILLDAPTGSGKTLIAEMVRRQFDYRGLYICSSLSLQTQFHRDFPTASILKGRSNYPTADLQSAFPNITAADCSKTKTTLPACYNCDPSVQGERPHCRWCHPVTACPYEQAKMELIQNKLGCTNLYYFLYEANYVGALPLNRKLIVIDEADTIETILLQFATVQMSSKKAAEYDIQPPAKKTVESAWTEWAIFAAEKLRNCLLSSRARGTDLDSLRYKISTERLYRNIERLNDPDTGVAAGGWVYTGYDKGTIAFKPIQVDHLAKTLLWRHCKNWLLMSATMISFQAMVDNLGIENMEVVNV